MEPKRLIAQNNSMCIAVSILFFFFEACCSEALTVTKFFAHPIKGIGYLLETSKINQVLLRTQVDIAYYKDNDHHVSDFCRRYFLRHLVQDNSAGSFTPFWYNDESCREQIKNRAIEHYEMIRCSSENESDVMENFLRLSSLSRIVRYQTIWQKSIDSLTESKSALDAISSTI